MMEDERGINYMIDYAYKILPRKIGMHNTTLWIQENLHNQSRSEWFNLVNDAMYKLPKISDEELQKETALIQIPLDLKEIVFCKYYKKIGPTNVFKWIYSYKFPENYEELMQIKKNWNNIISKLSNIKIHKKELYNDLARYYKDKSKTNYFKYRLLENYENYKDKLISFWRL